MFQRSEEETEGVCMLPIILVPTSDNDMVNPLAYA